MRDESKREDENYGIEGEVRCHRQTERRQNIRSYGKEETMTLIRYSYWIIVSRSGWGYDIDRYKLVCTQEGI